MNMNQILNNDKNTNMRIINRNSFLMIFINTINITNIIIKRIIVGRGR